MSRDSALQYVTFHEGGVAVAQFGPDPGPWKSPHQSRSAAAPASWVHCSLRLRAGDSTSKRDPAKRTGLVQHFPVTQLNSKEV